MGDGRAAGAEDEALPWSLLVRLHPGGGRGRPVSEASPSAASCPVAFVLSLGSVPRGLGLLVGRRAARAAHPAPKSRLRFPFRLAAGASQARSLCPMEVGCESQASCPKGPRPAATVESVVLGAVFLYPLFGQPEKMC